MGQKRLLEQKLRGVLSELIEVCDELGIDLGEALKGGRTSGLKERENFEKSLRLSAGEFLVAKLEGVEIGFVSHEVQELARIVEISPAADPRPEIEGYVNIRGDVLPVVHLRYLLFKRQRSYDLDQYLILLQSKRGRIVIVVDDVEDIYHIGEDQIKDLEALSMARGFHKGVIDVEGHLAPVIDPDRLIEVAL